MDYFDILLARKLANKGDITTESLSVTQNGIYTAPSGKAYTPVIVSVAPPEDSYQLKSITTPTSLATFEASAMPMPSLKVSVEAKQDLHGYDKPWVGGSGKNKLPLPVEQTINGVTLTHLPDGSIKLTGTPTGNVYFDCFAGTFDSTAYAGYRFKVSYMGATSGISFRISGSDRVGIQELYNDSVIADNGSGLYFALRIVFDTVIPSSGIIIYPMLLSPSETNYDFAPYSNICPISGWDEAKVSDVGKNLVESTLDNTTISTDGEINVSGGTSTFDMHISKIIKGETYTVQSDESPYDNKKFVGGFFYDMPQLGSISYNNARLANTPATFTAPIDGYVAFRTSHNYAYAQCEVGQTATSYEPYTSNLYTISLGQTVYGAEVDVVNGILKITDGYIASYNGETLPSTWISSMDEYAEGTTPTTGAEVCYELATPIIVPLTPSLIKSLEGTNNLSVDCGEVLEGEYFKALGGDDNA